MGRHWGALGKYRWRGWQLIDVERKYLCSSSRRRRRRRRQTGGRRGGEKRVKIIRAGRK